MKDGGEGVRQIDADALKANLELAEEEEYATTGYIPSMCDALPIIDAAPTIDAIPVEWMREKMMRPQMTDGNPFGFVLAEWLEEQEAR